MIISSTQAAFFWDELEKIGEEQPMATWKKVGIGAGAVAGTVGAAALGAKYGDRVMGGALYKKLLGQSAAAKKATDYADSVTAIPKTRQITGPVTPGAP